MASEKEKSPKVNFVSPTLTVWDEERDLGMLAAGLTLAKTATNRTLELDSSGKPVKRRTLDDMRHLSEDIKKRNRRK